MLMSLFPWLLYILAWVFALLEMQSAALLWPMLLFYVVIFNGGIQGLWGAIGHLAFPKKTAKKIGWTSNGFQTEIGFTNLAIGVTGILTFLFPFWAIPLGLFIAIYYSGCAYNHIRDRIVNKNAAPCNSGPMLYSTIVTVITIVVCLIAIFFVMGR